MQAIPTSSFRVGISCRCTTATANPTTGVASDATPVTDAAFVEALRASGERVRPLLDPARERAAWASLLAELRSSGD